LKHAVAVERQHVEGTEIFFFAVPEFGVDGQGQKEWLIAERGEELEIWGHGGAWGTWVLLHDQQREFCRGFQS